MEVGEEGDYTLREDIYQLGVAPSRVQCFVIFLRAPYTHRIWGKKKKKRKR